MICSYPRLVQHPAVFRTMTGFRPAEFDELVEDLRQLYQQAAWQRLTRPTPRRPARKRAVGAGHQFHLDYRDQLLLSVIWLRQYPTQPVLGYLFGVSASTVCRTVARLLPLLAKAGRATFALPQRGERSRRDLAVLLSDVPELGVVIDTFEQRVQRPKDRTEADGYYSGKQKDHTLKTQVVSNLHTGRVVDVGDSLPGPTNDLTALKQSGFLQTLPAEVAAYGDLAYVGSQTLHPGCHTPRRKPRGQPRPAADVAYNTWFAKQRIIVEHSIGRLRTYEALRQRDRHHRRHHTARTCAVAGLVNRQLAARFP